MMQNILGIYRAERFSPNSVENDRKIMQLVLDDLQKAGYITSDATEEEIVRNGNLPKADAIFSMARSQEAHRIIRQAGCKIINASDGVKLCGNRNALTAIMRELNVPCPPEVGYDGVWLKRSDGTAEVAEDTVFCSTKEEIERAIEAFHKRGITDIAHQAHIKGDLVKFYGVGNTPFFYHFYPTDSGRSKFGSEIHNGAAHHYDFSVQALKADIDRLASHIGVLVYGGDAIVTEEGKYYIIDFNDWPTFSPCREEAARHIADLVNG